MSFSFSVLAVIVPAANFTLLDDDDEEDLSLQTRRGAAPTGATIVGPSTVSPSAGATIVSSSTVAPSAAAGGDSAAGE